MTFHGFEKRNGDISAGCIFAEMLRRKPLLPGKNTQHQLNLIVEHLGFPDSETIARRAFERLSERAFEAEFG